MATSGIEARGVGMAFTTNQQRTTVLEDLDLSVRPGSFTTLLGPSGCGKSTLLKILGGILEPTSGEVMIGEDTARQAVARRDIGLVLQRPALLPWKTARENAGMLRALAGKGKLGDGAAEEALEMVGLAHAADRYPHQLSGGMAQRVSIARALAMEPSILLMDEPFGALDAITREVMNTTLARLWASTGKTIVFVTHSISEAVFLSDTVHVMGVDPGRIIDRVAIDIPRPRREGPVDVELQAVTTRLREQLVPAEQAA